MMLKFTNSAEEYKGNALYLNKEWIVSVYEHSIDGGSLSTIIFGGPQGSTWFVEESLNEAIKIINKA